MEQAFYNEVKRIVLGFNTHKQTKPLDRVELMQARSEDNEMRFNGDSGIMERLKIALKNRGMEKSDIQYFSLDEGHNATLTICGIGTPEQQRTKLEAISLAFVDALKPQIIDRDDVTNTIRRFNTLSQSQTPLVLLKATPDSDSICISGDPSVLQAVDARFKSTGEVKSAIGLAGATAVLEIENSGGLGASQIVGCLSDALYRLHKSEDMQRPILR